MARSHTDPHQHVDPAENARDVLLWKTTLAVAWVWLAILGVPMVWRGVPYLIGHRHASLSVLWTVVTHGCTIVTAPLVTIALWRKADWGYLLLSAVATNILAHSAYMWWLADFDITRMTSPVMAGPAMIAGMTLLAVLGLAVRRLRQAA